MFEHSMNFVDLQRASPNHHYTFRNFNFAQLNEVFILIHSADATVVGATGVTVQDIRIGCATFALSDATAAVMYSDEQLHLSCSCGFAGKMLCTHETRALLHLTGRRELTIFFDKEQRRKQLRKVADPYGLQLEDDLESFFEVELIRGTIHVKPKVAGLVAVSKELQTSWKPVPGSSMPHPDSAGHQAQRQLAVILKEHRYYRHLNIELIEGPLSQSGKLKNPLKSIDAMDRVWSSESLAESKFFSGISQLQNKPEPGNPDTTLKALKAILRNPCGLSFYHHDRQISETLVAHSLVPIHFGPPLNDIRLRVKKSKTFFEVVCHLYIEGRQFDIQEGLLTYDFFLKIEGIFHLVNDLNLLHLLSFFKKHEGTLFIHHSKFEEFRKQFLNGLEEAVTISYDFLVPATREQAQTLGLDEQPGKLIYLTDSDPFIHLNPVMRYGDIEIPVLSKKQLYSMGIKTNFRVARDNDSETEFIALLLKQHSWFHEQLEDSLPYFYLHKKYFLDEEWFLNAFEEWKNRGISILGFNKISQNRLNENKAEIAVKVLSGIDWFNAAIDVRYGKQKASLTQLKSALRNKNRYVPLDDGTVGILPEEWIRKFTEYFKAGEVVEDTLKIPKLHFQTIHDLFDEDMLDGDLITEIQALNQRLGSPSKVYPFEIPPELKTDLRAYQQHGLGWLNVLDDMNFGGCLADDMGLGKTIQILAFILAQRKKRKLNCNLLVVPTSLIFNWETEIQKYAPSISVLTLHGPSRTKSLPLNGFELIITSYGTMVSDVHRLRKHYFNYVILDESQNIKNCDSLRYKAACSLRSRNRLVITGTPIENNTFDLYGQLSFACPGLLGDKRHFRDIYSTPIDRFQNSKRAKELQQKVAPFILRRTKKEVAAELPEKTELVLFCEMGTEQRKIYDAYEREFRDYVCSKTDEELARNAATVLTGLTRLRQICNSPILLKDEEIDERSSIKIELLMDQILSKRTEHKILVFSQFVSMLELVKKELEDHHISYSYLTGSTRNRDKVVEEFQTQEQKRVFLISLKAGGTGLNLTEADYVYLIDPWWNPAVENQAIDRIYRIGQKNKVFAVRLICKHSIEEKMIGLQETKKELFNELIGKPTAFNKDEILTLLTNVNPESSLSRK